MNGQTRTDPEHSTADAGQARQDPGRQGLAAGPAYWFSMFAASAFGTNLGDYWVDGLALGRAASFASLAILAGLAILSDRKSRERGGAAYWLAIVVLRAAATNIGDFITHDLALGYLPTTVALAAITLAAGSLTRAGSARGGTPGIDGRYWMAMLVAGVFGTVGGDMASHSIGLYAAAALLCLSTVIVIAMRDVSASTSVIGYWCIVLAERCAGTPVGDMLASHRALGLGLPVAMACTGGLLLVALLGQWHASRR